MVGIKFGTLGKTGWIKFWQIFNLVNSNTTHARTHTALSLSLSMSSGARIRVYSLAGLSQVFRYVSSLPL